MINTDYEFENVKITPFLHQVGGHTCVLQVTPITICKPYQEKEVLFYQNLPPNLKDFVPYFQGIINIQCDIHNEEISFHANVPTDVLKHYHQCQSLYPNIFPLAPYITDNVVSSDDEEDECDDEDNSKTGTSLGHIKEGLGTWSLQCIQRQIHRYGYWAHGESQRFIMLENLVAFHRFPCVMDLKMGTKHGSGYSSEDKRKLLEDRWLNSTSSSLGFRVCGIQAYKVNSNSYVAYDKYYGRDLDVNGVRNELRSFLHNGERLRTDLIAAILVKLKTLHDVLRLQTSFKLFACSLLLLYDGTDVPEEEQTGDDSVIREEKTGIIPNFHFPVATEHCNVDVRLIDFANAVPMGNCSEEQKQIDSGVLFGLENLIDMLESFL